MTTKKPRKKCDCEPQTICEKCASPEARILMANMTPKKQKGKQAKNSRIGVDDKRTQAVTEKLHKELKQPFSSLPQNCKHENLLNKPVWVCMSCQKSATKNCKNKHPAQVVLGYDDCVEWLK